MLKANATKQSLEAAGLSLMETGFDALCWLYQFRKLRVLERLNIIEAPGRSVVQRLDAAIADLEAALTAAGVDLKNSTFVDDSGEDAQ